jgi:hypothetical protein
MAKAVTEGVVTCLRLDVPFRVCGVERAMQLLVEIDVGLERERRVQHGLDALVPVIPDRFLDAVSLRRGVLDDVGARHLREACKEVVVLREIGVAKHVRGDQRVLGERVRIDEIAVARIAGEHHLEDPRVAHRLTDQLVDVAHAERPVRHADRQPVDRHLVHEVAGNELEIHRVIREPERLRQRLDALAVILQALVHVGLREAHAASARATCSWKNCLSAFHTSSRLVTRAMPSGRFSRCARAKMPAISVSGEMP